MNDPILVAASRRAGEGGNTVVEPPEVRRIVVAQGIEFTRQNRYDLIAQHPEASPEAVASVRAGIFPDAMPARVPGVFLYEWEGRHRALYYSPAQHVVYAMETVDDKRRFMEALGTEGIIVIYDGHARYGRGPCFGPDPAPGDDWEAGTEPTSRGLFRMGFPHIAVPVHEVLAHGYRATLLPASEPRPDRASCDPDMRPHLDRLAPLRVSAMHPDPAVVAQLARQVGVEPEGDERFWTYHATGDAEHGRECHVVLRAGWSDPSYPFNLAATELRCRMFCHLGCSTFSHNYPVLRKLKGWKRDGDARFAYWTTAPSLSGTTVTLLSHLMTYPEYSAGESWVPWLRYGVRKANQELRRTGMKYQLI